MAVYTELTHESVTEFLRAYALGDVLLLKGIPEGVENTNYLLVTTSGTFILTLYEKRVRKEDLPFFLGLMEHLARKGIACPQPIRAKDGLALRELQGRPAALCSFMQGSWPRSITTNHCSQLGQAMGQFHLAGASFPDYRRNDLSITGWKVLATATYARADTIQTGLASLIGNEIEWLSFYWPTALPSGVIHADLFPDNVFFLENQLSGIIDLYFSCNDLLVYDLAISINAWCFEQDGMLNTDKALALVAGYRAVRPLTPEELQALPILARGAALRFLLTRLADWLDTPDGALVTRKDPLEYLARLQFHQSVKEPAGYGIVS